MPNTYELDRVLPFVGQGMIELDGEVVKIGRFVVFHKKGTSCVRCGLKATFFKKAKNNGTTILNLYALRGTREVMMTRDHIIPASRGGTKELKNMQPMCEDCNTKKGDFISFEDRIYQSIHTVRRLFRRIWYTIKGTITSLKAIWRR